MKSKIISIAARILNESYSEKDLVLSVTEILHGTELMAMASSLPSNGGGYSNTAYFSYNENLDIYFVSDEDAQHCLNLAANPRVSLAIWLQPKVFAEGLRGVQLFGTSTRATEEKAIEGLRTRKERFADFKPSVETEDTYVSGLGKSAIFLIKPNRLKLIDETRFGRRNYISAEVKTSAN